ncbi:MAG: DUF488 domain-containing protein [Anaerolineaceae bacterium]|nr:DUF488 domain-containing protein [Anaerolineaceae bacterium]MDE0327585.1 DUF488 domain-containing protein [Anaerolineaceae bacterium]
MTEPAVRIYTIGFTQKNAARFFGLLREHGITKVLDTRRRPGSQLSRFAHGDDLAWLLAELVPGCEYEHRPDMAPAAELLDRYRGRGPKSQHITWRGYAGLYLKNLRDRNLIAGEDRAEWAAGRYCLLCSEHEPDNCHRRLLANEIRKEWSGTKVVHL